MLTFEEIKELIELVASHRMTGIEVERSGFRLKIDGYQAAETVVAAAPALVAAPAAPAAAPAASAAAAPAPPAGAEAAEAPPAAEAESAADVIVQKSPIVGTFYRRPSPDQPPFVEVGQTVSKGQVLCIIEAMKLMNEIESEVDGVVTEVLPKNSQAVEFGEPLFKIKAS